MTFLLRNQPEINRLARPERKEAPEREPVRKARKIDHADRVVGDQKLPTVPERQTHPTSTHDRRGGFRELVTRGETGPIGITVKFRESGGRLATYQLDIAGEEGRPVVEREILKFRRGQYGKPWHFVDFSRGRGWAITNEAAYGQKGVEQERKEHQLDDPSVLAIKGLGQFKEFRVVAEFRSLIENWHISDFHISDARPSVEAGYAEHLSMRGDNVAQVAQFLYEYHRDRFDRVLEAMKERIPGVSNVQAKPTEDGRLVLRFQDGSFQDPFIARYVSDGTIKMFAYLVLLYDPRPHPLLAVEEPENQNRRTSSIPICSMNWSRNSGIMRVEAGRCSCPPTHRIFSTARNLRKSTGWSRNRVSPRSGVLPINFQARDCCLRRAGSHQPRRLPAAEVGVFQCSEQGPSQWRILLSRDPGLPGRYRSPISGEHGQEQCPGGPNRWRQRTDCSLEDYYEWKFARITAAEEEHRLLEIIGAMTGLKANCLRRAGF